MVFNHIEVLSSKPRTLKRNFLKYTTVESVIENTNKTMMTWKTLSRPHLIFNFSIKFLETTVSVVAPSLVILSSGLLIWFENIILLHKLCHYYKIYRGKTLAKILLSFLQKKA